MRSRRVLVALAVLAVVAALVVVALRRRGPVPPQLAAPNTPPRELRVGLAGLGELNTLDPARAGTSVPIILVWQMYERLVVVDDEGRVQPQLATRWEASPDLKTWRFFLRQDAHFHPHGALVGRPVAGADVRASLLRALAIPGFAQTLLSDVVAGAEDIVAGRGVGAVGIDAEPDSVTFHLARPFAFFPQRLAASFLSVVPADTPPDALDPPPGSGPYRLLSWDRGRNRVALQRTSPGPGPDSLTFQVFETEAAAVAELERGTVDWLETTSAALPLLRQARGIRIDLPPQLDVKLVAANQTRSPFKDSFAACLALNLATDRRELTTVLGGGSPVAGPIPGRSGLDFDLERARSLTASLPASARSLDMLVMPGAESRTLAEVLARQWQRAGFQVTLTPGLADFFDRVVAGNYQLALAYYGPFAPVAEQYLWPYRKSAQPIPNAMRFASPVFEAALARYTAAGVPQAQLAALAEAERALLDRPPVVWLLRAPQVVAARGGYAFERWGAMPVFARPQPLVP